MENVQTWRTSLQCAFRRIPTLRANKDCPLGNAPRDPIFFSLVLLLLSRVVCDEMSSERISCRQWPKTNTRAHVMHIILIVSCRLTVLMQSSQEYSTLAHSRVCQYVRFDRATHRQSTGLRYWVGSSTVCRWIWNKYEQLLCVHFEICMELIYEHQWRGYEMTATTEMVTQQRVGKVELFEISVCRTHSMDFLRIKMIFQHIDFRVKWRNFVNDLLKVV